MNDKLKYMPTGKKLEIAQKILALLQEEIPEAKYHFGEQVEALALAYAALTGASNLLDARRN